MRKGVGERGGVGGDAPLSGRLLGGKVADLGEKCGRAADGHGRSWWRNGFD